VELSERKSVTNFIVRTLSAAKL